jgi:hypothetical protein
LKFIITFFILFLFGQAEAQHITICKAYTQAGEPIDIIYSKNISLNQTICILLNAGNKKISGSAIFLFIDRTADGLKQNQFNKVYKIDKDKNWLACNFKFAKDGKFEIYFTDANQNRIAATTIIVGNYKETPSDQSISANNYINVEAVFCENVLSGLPINPKQNVSLKSDGGLVCLYLKSSSPLNTERIHVTIMRKSNYSIDYDEFVASKKYQLNSNWEDVFFKYTFTKTGEYKFSVADENELLIKTAYITVIN